MTILAWTPYDKGHISQVTIAPGDNTYLSLRPGSYNFVDVYPAWLVVNNVENSGDVDVVTDSGLTVTVPGATSKSIIIAMHSGVRIQNNNAFSIECTVFDSRISRDIIDGFTASLLAARQIDYALLAHFNANNERMLGDGRVSAANYTVTSGGKFGNCLSLPASTANFPIALESPIAIATKPCTVDFWCRIPSTLTSATRILYSHNNANVELRISAPTGSSIRFDLKWGNATATQITFTVVGSGSYMQTWRHIAIEARATSATATSARVFLEGVLGANISASSAASNDSEVRLGDPSSPTVLEFDELRILRYPAYLGQNFTPPTTPYT